jgi:hypothetical protein
MRRRPGVPKRRCGVTISIYSDLVGELELIGIDKYGRSLRLQWSDVPGWVLERESASDQWTGIATYMEQPPVRALPFAQWLLQESRLHWDIIEEAVEALRDTHPDRFNDPLLGPSEDVAAIHQTQLD